MRKILLWLIVLSSIRLYTASVSPAPGDNIKTDYESSWTRREPQTYWVNASTGHTFAVSETKVGGGCTLFSSGSQHASAFKLIAHWDEPQTNSFPFWVEGYFAGSGNGSRIRWEVSLEQRFFWLAPAEKVISAGTAQEINAKGYLPTSRWIIRNKVLKDWRDGDSAEEEVDSVTLSNNMWVKMLWMPSPFPWYYKIPEGGDYHIGATTVAEGSRTAYSYIKVIEAQFIKETIYKSWNKFETFDVVSYLTPASHDKSNFSWAVQGDAKLKMTINNQTVYNSTFTPSETSSFSNLIRFDKSSGQTDDNVTVTATSGDLTSVSGTLTIVPQSLNIDISGVPEEEYDADGSLTAESKKVNEGTIGAFIPVNDGDLNEDRNVDYEHETESASGTAAGRLIAVSISAVLDEDAIINADYPVRITLSHGGFRVWKDADRSELYIDGSGTKEFTTLEGLDSVYVEATSASISTLTISYSYSHAGDVTTRKQYMISATDSIKLNGFKVDISVQGVDNEKTFTSGQTTIRTLAYEEFPGGEIEVLPLSGLTTIGIDGETGTKQFRLIPVTLSGSNLLRDSTQMDLPANTPHPDANQEVSFTCASDKIEFYERSLTGTGTPKEDADGNPIYNIFNANAIKADLLPKTIYMRPLKDSDSKRDVTLELSYTSPQNAAEHKDIVKLTLLKLDVDVDSNNDGTISVDDETEDSIEMTAPGKLITVNNGDLDEDGIEDNKDFEISKTGGFDSPIFTEMKIRLPKSINLDNCKIKFDYTAVAPPATEGGAITIPANTSALRIWKKQSNEQRNPAAVAVVGAPVVANADYISSGSFLPAESVGSSRDITLYVEGISAGPAPATITVDVQPIESRPTASTDLSEEDKIPETYSLSDSVMLTPISVTVTHMAFNHNRANGNSDGINLRQSYTADTELRAPEYIIAGGASGTLPTGETGIYNGKTILYKSGIKPTVLVRFTVQPDNIGSLNLYAVGQRKKLDGTDGVEALSFGGLGDATSGVSVPFTMGTSTGSNNIDAINGFVSFEATGNTPTNILKEKVSFRWYIKGINGKALATGMPIGIPVPTDDLNIYTITDEPLSPWNANDTNPAFTPATDNKYQPWQTALEFAVITADSQNKSNSMALRSITSFLHSGHGLVYDTVRGAPRYYDYLTAALKLTDYMNRALGSIVNCYDQASAVTILGRLLGITAEYQYMSPFGYINTTNLIGVGNCNNPFYHSPQCTDQRTVVDSDATFPVRTGFGNHAFVKYSGMIYDACAGPATGTQTIDQYIDDVIDKSTPAESSVAGDSSDVTTRIIVEIE